jgi:hypothetical protein
MVYYCNAGPNLPNDITFENANNVNPADILNNSNPQKYSNITAVLPQNAGHETAKIGEPIKVIGPEVYLCEITSFYERIITILSIIIGLILGLNFLYIHVTSKRQAEDMARSALAEDSFKIKLEKMMDDAFVTAKNKGDIKDIFEQLAELNDNVFEINERVKYLEENANKNSYNINKPEQNSEGEVKNGDN